MGLMVSEDFLSFSSYKSKEANEPQGVANTRDMVETCVGGHKTVLHA